MAFASQWLVHCSDDACVRTVSLEGELVHTHSVMEEPAEGKRPRQCAIDHCVVLDGGAAYAAAAGRLVHACRVADGKLQHALRSHCGHFASCRRGNAHVADRVAERSRSENRRRGS